MCDLLPTSEWFWEGNVQDALIHYLKTQGWIIEHASDTVRGEHGPDIIASKAEQIKWIEVKGYPSTKYVKGERIGQLKRTQPTLQAKHWLSDALFSLIQRRTKNEDIELMIALPNFKRYHDLSNEIKWALCKLGIGIYFIKEDGAVEELYFSDHKKERL